VDELRRCQSPVSFELMQQLKDMLDHEQLMNPGKIFNRRIVRGTEL
jgi:FAD/FMN-containing dehydrogenase